MFRAFTYGIIMGILFLLFRQLIDLIITNAILRYIEVSGRSEQEYRAALQNLMNAAARN